ncbi:hypothetical protein [Hymenobacter cellulosilyticus]|uniref:Uncharacterized protein n=1 Tax=Hymenobacter cellulosilyticus TaxID=2932248 RepID=A0A8T9QD21_9BACT|nr:hypothetical protein [Hymenobacter cellulosilyticus]UOQ75125.1 hypothetical protein MUN79_29055 [Hymenobacter cellulosilyticus]
MAFTYRITVLGSTSSHPALASFLQNYVTSAKRFPREGDLIAYSLAYALRILGCAWSDTPATIIYYTVHLEAQA